MEIGKKLKPEDIRSKEFNKKLFGYDPDEVDAFLIEVANAYQDLLRDLENLKRNTPEYKTEEIVEKARRKIEEIIQKKMEEKEELERQKKEIELEIEKLRLAQKKIFDRLKMAIIDMTRIIEELRPNAKNKDKGKSNFSGSEGSTQSFTEQNRESGRGETEDKDNSST
ncbi:MAG: DivIVA domain-containing protein [Desulfurobacteriaceae bacterium]